MFVFFAIGWLNMKCGYCRKTRGVYRLMSVQDKNKFAWWIIEGDEEE